MHYVYILSSQLDPAHHCTGSTRNLQAHLQAHNQGKNRHTAKYRLWQIETAIAFRDQQEALAFKTGSCRAHAKRHC